MRVIPVIDLKGGIAVRAVGGRRHEYRPVTSLLTADNSPAGVARAYRDQLGLDELYVADLDAIAGAKPHWSVYDELLALGSRLWLDAGLTDAASAKRLAAYARGAQCPSRIIVGLESLARRSLLPVVLEVISPQRLALSIDLCAGRPLAADPAWRERPPEGIAAEAIELGLRSLIVLDLAYVGENRGPGALELCSSIRRLSGEVEIVSGGGVRSEEDLAELAAAGCDVALVASALHDGRLRNVGHVSKRA